MVKTGENALPNPTIDSRAIIPRRFPATEPESAALPGMKAAATLAIVLLSACLMPPPQSGSGPTYASSSGSPSSTGTSDGSDPSFASGSPAATQAAAPAPSGPVSVTIRSSCSKTVKVFYGDKPKFGSGTYSSISSNSVQSHSFQEGDLFWIVDESENGISSASISRGTRELEIGSSCSGISAR